MTNKRCINKTLDLLAVSKNRFISALKAVSLCKEYEKKDVSQAQINRIAASVDKAKSKLEKSLKKKFNLWQAEAINLFLKQMADGASVLFLNQDLKNGLEKTLLNHWYEVAEVFVPGVEFDRAKAEDQPIDAPSSEEHANETDTLIPILLIQLRNDIESAINFNKTTHLGNVVDTTQRIANDAKSLSGGDLFEADATMKSKMAARSTTVSVTETQWVSQIAQNVAIEDISPLMETATQDQLKQLQRVSPNVRLKTTDIDELFAIGAANEIDLFRRQLRNPQKMWVTMGDKRVRSSHRMANGMIVGLNEAFKLVGGLLRFPTDAGLGASLNEIIGCRCHCFYF